MKLTTFGKIKNPEAEQYYLEIQGANSSADVYLHGKKLAHHDGGYSTWRVDLTDKLRKLKNELISLHRSGNDEEKPKVMVKK